MIFENEIEYEYEFSQKDSKLISFLGMQDDNELDSIDVLIKWNVDNDAFNSKYEACPTCFIQSITTIRDGKQIEILDHVPESTKEWLEQSIADGGLYNDY